MTLTSFGKDIGRRQLLGQVRGDAFCKGCLPPEQESVSLDWARELLWGQHWFWARGLLALGKDLPLCLSFCICQMGVVTPLLMGQWWRRERGCL